MGVRRWLTAEYDMTGLSRRLYTSMKVYWITVIFWALLPLIMIGLMHSVAKGWIESTWGVEIAIITESVQLNGNLYHLCYSFECRCRFSRYSSWYWKVDSYFIPAHRWLLRWFEEQDGPQGKYNLD